MDTQLKALKDATLADPYVFSQIMGQEKISKKFLELLLNCKIKKITPISEQDKPQDPLVSSNIWLDVCLEDGQDTLCKVSMQSLTQETDPRDLERRIRCCQAYLDGNIWENGIPYAEVPDTYIILVCSFDCYGYGLPLYLRVDQIRGYSDLAYTDGSHVWILNSAYTHSEANAPKELLEFLSYLHDEKSAFESDFVKDICAAVNDLRSDPAKEAAYRACPQKVHKERSQAYEEAVQEGEKRMIALLNRLIQDGRTSEIPKVLGNAELKRELFRAYNL